MLHYPLLGMIEGVVRILLSVKSIFIEFFVIKDGTNFHALSNPTNNDV